MTYSDRAIATSARLAGALIIMLALLAAFALNSSASATNESELTRQVIAAKQQAATTGEPMVRFAAGGFWDATTNEAYIDEGARVALLVKNKLVDLSRGVRHADGQAPLSTTSAATDICSVKDNLTHCEPVLNRSGCNPTYAYLRYVGDDFQAPYGPPAYPGEQINVRNSPYRTLGARGVRVYRTSQWLWMSDNCL